MRVCVFVRWCGRACVCLVFAFVCVLVRVFSVCFRMRVSACVFLYDCIFVGVCSYVRVCS